jgi:hypothetical protein
MKNRLLVLIILCASCLSHTDALASNDGANVKVLKVANTSAGLGDKIRLILENLEALDREAEAKNKQIIPYVDGLPLTGVKTFQPSNNVLEFILRRYDKAKETWTTLVEQRDSFFSGKVVLSVGLEDAVAVPSSVTDFQIIMIKKSWFVTCSIAIIFILALFIWLARSSNMIRDSGPEPEGGDRKPFSLGRTQMALWFFLVIASYPFLWLTTGDLGTITTSLIGLMGISAGTALGATVIDIGKRNAAIADKEKLLAQRKALNTRISEIKEATSMSPQPQNLDSLKTELDNKRSRLAEVEQQILRTPAAERGRVSKGFFLDVVSDCNGVSFHRFQILAWTIVLGIIFIAEVYNNLRMPEFSETLLALMGISSGTYIGFKFPERRQT